MGQEAVGLADQRHRQSIGKVTTDSIQYMKSLDLNETTRQPFWNFISAKPIAISNSIALNQIEPYREMDYEVINQMLNHLKSGEATVKSNLIESLNSDYEPVLETIVQENNDTFEEKQFIEYSYADYHGEFIVGFDNYIRSLQLGSRGLDLLLSTSIQNDPDFECGEEVPDKPRDEVMYGGLQEFYSNCFIKYTLNYAMKEGWLDIVLSEEKWQSPAFQFYMGDLHEVMPSSKNISSLQKLTGRCVAQNDKSFKFEAKTSTSYDVQVNFTCELSYKGSKILGITVLVVYEVTIVLQTDQIDFKITSISGEPEFDQFEGWEIRNMDLAQFMVSETLKMAEQQLVLGSGFKTMVRKIPVSIVEKDYLFMYDSGAKPYQPDSLSPA